MARKRKRYKPSAKAICAAMTADDTRGRIHVSDLDRHGRGMRPWLEKHGHIRRAGGAFFTLTRKGKRLADRACTVSFGR